MKKLLIAVFLVGCGGNGNSDPLAETAWTVPIVGAPCDYALGFYADGTYMDATVCTFTDGSVGAEIDRGTYGTNGTKLAIAVSQTSCPSAQGGTVDFSLSGGSLTLTAGAGILVMSRLPNMPGGSGTIPFGCFDANWAFTPMPLHSL